MFQSNCGIHFLFSSRVLLIFFFLLLVLFGDEEINSSDLAFSADGSCIMGEAGPGTLASGVVSSCFFLFWIFLPFEKLFSNLLTGWEDYWALDLAWLSLSWQLFRSFDWLPPVPWVFPWLFGSRIWPGDQLVCRANNVTFCPLLLP